MRIEYFQFPGLPWVRCAFTGRSSEPSGGNLSYDTGDASSNVSGNRSLLLKTLNQQGLTGWHELKQVHGTDLVIEPAATDPLKPRNLKPADGAMTTEPGLGLLIKTADCQPILLADRTGRHIMALHCGWRGNRANFPKIAVREFAEHYGLAPADILAVRGPSLGPAKAEFKNFATEWDPEFAPWFSPVTKTMDLWRLTRDQLMDAGIPESQIFGIDICTQTEHTAWFSYRQNHATGRQASLIWIAAGERK